MNDLQCPKCSSVRVRTMSEHLSCLDCGHSEYLYDYHNSYDTRQDRRAGVLTPQRLPVKLL